MSELREEYLYPTLTVDTRGHLACEQRTLLPLAVEFALARAEAPTLKAVIEAGTGIDLGWTVGVPALTIRVAWQSVPLEAIEARWRELKRR